MMLYICTMFLEIMLDGLEVRADTQFPYDFHKNVYGVTGLVLCTLSDDALNLDQV